MTRLNGFAFAAALAVVLPASPFIAHAEPAATTIAAADDAKSDTKMSDADKRAKAADCSKQADEKKLHGAERKKFRAACKRK